MLLFSMNSCGDNDYYFDLPIDPEFEDSKDPTPDPAPDPDPVVKKYTNPLLITDESDNILESAVILDPCILKVDNTFYLYSASEGWADGTRPLIGIYKSEDLVHWTFVKGAINSEVYKPVIGDWLQGVKAFCDNGKYGIYFVSNNNILCFVSDTPDGDYVAYNKTESEPGDGILRLPEGYSLGYDGLPSFIEENGQKYLLFRNRTEEWNANLYLLEMKDYSTFQEPLNAIKISDDNVQCPSLVKMNGRYFILSKSGFYFGAAPFKIYSSDRLTGTYICTEKTFLDTDENINGIDAIVQDANNDYWALYSKCFDKHNLCLDKVLFDADGFPYIKNKKSSTDEQPAPVFE